MEIVCSENVYNIVHNKQTVLVEQSKLNYYKSGFSPTDEIREAKIISKLLGFDDPKRVFGLESGGGTQTENVGFESSGAQTEAEYTKIRKGFNNAMKQKFVSICCSLFGEPACLEVKLMKKREPGGGKKKRKIDDIDGDGEVDNDVSGDENQNDDYDDDAQGHDGFDEEADAIRPYSLSKGKSKHIHLDGNDDDNEQDEINKQLDQEDSQKHRESFQTCPYFALLQTINSFTPVGTFN